MFQRLSKRRALQNDLFTIKGLNIVSKVKKDWAKKGYSKTGLCKNVKTTYQKSNRTVSSANS